MAPRSCLLAILLASLSFPAWGQQPTCIPLEIIDRVLASYGEAPSTEMVDGGEATIRIYANVETGQWHMFVIAKGGNAACLAAAGDKYTRYPTNIGRPS